MQIRASTQWYEIPLDSFAPKLHSSTYEMSQTRATIEVTMEPRQIQSWPARVGLLVMSLVMGLVPLSALAVGDAEKSAAISVVEELQTTLLQAMQNGGELGYDGRYELLDPVVARTHDLEYIAAFALRRAWRGLKPFERDLFNQKFRELSVSMYASRFKEYHGERFEVLETENMPGRKMLVRGQLRKADGGLISFEYLLRKSERQWQIVNIIVDGVSDLALKRAEYTNEINRSGFAGLIEMLDKQIAENSGQEVSVVSSGPKRQ